MTEAKAFKRRVRERMSKTGESYTTARVQVASKRDRVVSARQRPAPTGDRPSDESVVRATGKTWDEWFAILDRSGGTKKKHGEMTSFLLERYEIPGWWTQAVVVNYERSRGLRRKHEREDGFSVTASKTIAVPLDTLFEAFVNDAVRRKWLGGSLRLRTAQENRSARFDWEDGSTRVNVGFTAKGESKAMVSVAHEKIPDPEDAERFKASWRKWLGDLQAFLVK